jgi:hypothetical protein
MLAATFDHSAMHPVLQAPWRRRAVPLSARHPALPNLQANAFGRRHLDMVTHIGSQRRGHGMFQRHVRFDLAGRGGAGAMAYKASSCSAQTACA